MRHFTVMADLNVVQKQILCGDLSFFYLFYSVYQVYIVITVAVNIQRHVLNLILTNE